MIKISFSDTDYLNNILKDFKQIVITTLGNKNSRSLTESLCLFLEVSNNLLKEDLKREKKKLSKNTRNKKINNQKRKENEDIIKANINNLNNQIQNSYQLKDIKRKIISFSSNIDNLIIQNNPYEFLNKECNRRFAQILEKVFCKDAVSNKWKSFRDNVNEILYDVFKSVDIRVCPYCNRSYIPVIKYSNKTLSPEMDHFYPKESYPYLAFSFYNLVPICSTCNGRLKHKKVCNILHPYKEDFGDNIKFKLHSNEETNYINLLSGSIPKNEHFTIELVYKKEIKDSYKDYFERCKKSNEVFHIRETYDLMHKQDAIDLVRKMALFRPNYSRSYVAIINPNLRKLLSKKNKSNDELLVDSLIDYGKKHYTVCKENITNNIAIIDDYLKQIDNDMLKLLFGNWLDESNDLKEPLSKFKRDIYQQFTSLKIDDYKPLEKSESPEI